MEFFYTTSAGAIDFAVLIFAVATGLWFGRPHIRLLAIVASAVFLYDRYTLLAFSEVHLPLAGIAGCLVGIVAIIWQSRHRTSLAFAALYALKIQVHVLMIAGLVGFETMAALVTVAVYGQILLILGGTANGSGKLSRNSRRFAHSGRDFAFHTLARWGAISPPSVLSQQINPQPATVRKENCRG